MDCYIELKDNINIKKRKDIVMLKKLALIGALAVGVIITGQAKVSPTMYLSNETPVYYDYNINFPQMYSRMSSAEYADATSAVILEKDDSHAVMAINVFFVRNADKSYSSISGYKTYKFYYDIKGRKAFLIRDSGEYYYINPKGAGYQKSWIIEPAEATYYLLTGEKFHGPTYFSQRFYDSL